MEILSKKYMLQNSIELNTNSLANGMYLLKISDREKEGIQKVVIQH